jgi:hypothetical protein
MSYHNRILSIVQETMHPLCRLSRRYQVVETRNGPHPGRDHGPELTTLSNARARMDRTTDRTPGREPRGPDPRRLSGPEPFQILQSTVDGRRVIAPRGELDLSNAAQLEERLAGNIDTAFVHRQQRHPRADQHRPESSIASVGIHCPEPPRSRPAGDQTRRARSTSGPRKSRRGLHPTETSR